MIAAIWLRLANLVFTSTRDDDRGASLVEYALVLALIAVICIAGLRVLGTSTSTSYSRSNSSLFG